MTTDQHREAIAAEVRAAKSRAKVSTVTLAEAINISASAMGRKIRAEVSFTADELVAVAVALGLNPSQLLPIQYLDAAA